MKQLITVIPFMLLFLFGCAAPKLDVVDQTGRTMPNPHYVMRSIDKSISVLFYYSVISIEKDLDGYDIPVQKYLPLNQHNYISMKKYKYIMVNVEVRNPTEKEYAIWEMVTWKPSTSEDSASGRRVGYSNRSYRSYTIQLPKENKVKYRLQLLGAGGNLLMFLGDFKYSSK